MDLLGDCEDKPSSLPQSVLDHLLIQPDDAQQSTEPDFRFVTPEAGFCLKTRTDKGKKVFVNICHSEQIPGPRAITDEQLAVVLESQDPAQFRVPLSLGQPHSETDTANKECTAYDVVVNAAFFAEILKRPMLKSFLLTVVLEGLEDKYSILLDRDCKILKNRKFLGPLPEQTVRKKAKPFIVEVESKNPAAGSGKKKPLISEVEERISSAPEPAYTMVREPVDGDLPDFLVMEVQLPGMPSSRHLSLEVGEDRVVLKTRPEKFFLDVDLPFLVDSDESGAQFNQQTRVLTATLPVTGPAPLL